MTLACKERQANLCYLAVENQWLASLRRGARSHNQTHDLQSEDLYSLER